MRAWPTASLLLLALWTSPAFAQQRVTVENFPKDKRGAIRAQLAAAVCAQAECVPPSRVQTHKHLDWKKVAHERLQAVVSGTLAGKGTKQKLKLTLVDARKQILWKKSLNVVRGSLPPRPLGAAVQELLATLANSPPPAAGPETPATPPPGTPPKEEPRPFFAETPKSPETPPPAPATEADAGTPPPPVVEGTPPAPTEQPPAEPLPVTPSARVYPILVAELGTDVLFRTFSYQALETGNLFGYRGSGIVMPSLHVEVYPLAPITNSVAGGLGLTGDVAFAVGLQSSLPDGTEFPTRVTRYGIGLKWALRPIQGSSFNFGPELGYRNWSFQVLPGAGNTTIDQLPDLTYSGLDVGLGVELPLGSVATLSARGAYLPVLSASKLLSPDFFPHGSAGGFSGEVSLGFFVGLGQILEVRLTFLYTQYNLYFTDVGSSDAFRATGSTDRYLGGRLGLRVRW